MESPISNTFTKNSHNHPTKKKALPSARLGGGRGEKKIHQVFMAAKFIGRVKVKCMVEKVKKYSESLVKEIKEGGKTLESIQQRFIMQTSLSVPLMAPTFNSNHKANLSKK
uniref:Uncharacterized protein n=1 Tax=Solanum tuberosum TaxID=4113 RepID=M0ZZ53_SOLTU